VYTSRGAAGEGFQVHGEYGVERDERRGRFQLRIPKDGPDRCNYVCRDKVTGKIIFDGSSTKQPSNGGQEQKACKAEYARTLGGASPHTDPQCSLFGVTYPTNPRFAVNRVQ
jgi:hypothetical protein